MSPFVFVLGILFIVIGIPTICATAVSLSKMWQGKGRSKSSRLDAEETKIMQELHQGLVKLEKRIEDLETIIIDKK